MGKRRAAAELRRDAEFEAFTAGAAGRLLHTALLLTGDPQEADRLLTATLARTYANWFRMRAEDPYERARSELVRRFAYRPWWRRPHGGTLDRLSAQERIVITMRFFEGVAEEQTAAQLGLPAERVRGLCARATATLRSRSPGPSGQAGAGPSGRAEPSGRAAAPDDPEPPGGTATSGGAASPGGAAAAGASSVAGAALQAGGGGPETRAAPGEPPVRKPAGSPVSEVTP